MVTIIILIITIGLSALATWGVVIGIQKWKTIKPIKLSLPKIPKIVFPKIKIPSFNFIKRPKITSVTILNPTFSSDGNVFQEEYWNTTSKPTNNKSSFPIPKNAWVWMVGVVVIGFVAFYFMHKWKMSKR